MVLSIQLKYVAQVACFWSDSETVRSTLKFHAKDFEPLQMLSKLFKCDVFEFSGVSLAEWRALCLLHNKFLVGDYKISEIELDGHYRTLFSIAQKVHNFKFLGKDFAYISADLRSKKSHMRIKQLVEWQTKNKISWC